MKKLIKWIIAVILVIGTLVLTLYFVYMRPFLKTIQAQERLAVDSGLTLYMGGGGNSGVVVSDSLVLVVDTKMAGFETAFHDTVMQVAGRKALLVVNTHWHPDHVAGNHLFPKESLLAGGSYSTEEWKKEAGESSLPGHWLKGSKLVPLGQDTAILFDLAENVHTPSDVIIYLKQRKVLFGGDVILNKQAPALFGKADARGYVKAMRYLLATYEINTVVPGHGPIGGKEVVEQFITYFEDMETAAKYPDRESELIKKYSDWNQIPFAMSPGTTISFYKKHP